jgi:hypothetical protein
MDLPSFCIPGAGMLITEEYREMQRKLHENPNYGVASIQYAPLVADLVRAVGATELLDYGAGKGRLSKALREHMKAPLKVAHYDPAVPEWSKPAAPCTMVACIDVLEHIEPHLLDNVLEDLKRVTLRHGVFTVHTQPALKVLPDGRNAHLIQQPPTWWLPKIMDRFELLTFNAMPMGFWVAVERQQPDAAMHGAVTTSSAEMLANVIGNLGVAELLDYSAGESRLEEKLRERLDEPVEIVPYDAAQPRLPARQAAMVACIDVLQNVEPERLDDVLDDLERVTSRYGTFTVIDVAAGTAGPEGRAAPRMQQPPGWWLAKLMDRFELVNYNRMPQGFGVVVERKGS